MEPKKVSYTKIIVGGLLIIAYFFMRGIGLTFGDLWRMAQGEIDETRSEIKEYRTGEYTKELSRQLRSEAGKIATGQPSGGTIDSELRSELLSERQRIMEEQARNAEKISKQVLKGDAEVLKQKARENAQKAGGND